MNKWTNEPPKKEGFYWIKYPNGLISVAEVIEYDENPFDELDPEYEIYGGFIPRLLVQTYFESNDLISGDFDKLLWNVNQIKLIED